MRRVIWVAAISTSVAGVLGVASFALLLRQPMLGFEDTDDPALGVLFVRVHPEVFAQTGLVLILAAYLVVQMAGVQGVLPAGLLALGVRASVSSVTGSRPGGCTLAGTPWPYSPPPRWFWRRHCRCRLCRHTSCRACSPLRTRCPSCSPACWPGW